MLMCLDTGCRNNLSDFVSITGKFYWNIPPISAAYKACFFRMFAFDHNFQFFPFKLPIKILRQIPFQFR